MKPCISVCGTREEYNKAYKAYSCGTWNAVTVSDAAITFEGSDCLVFNLSLSLKENAEEIMINPFWFKQGYNDYMIENDYEEFIIED